MSTHTSGCNDGPFPLGWFLAYTAVALTVWITTAVLLSGIAGLLWPGAATAAAVWWIVTNINRDYPHKDPK